MTLVGTALNLGEKMKIYPQVGNLKFGYFTCCVADDGKEIDKSEKRTCRACKAIVFAH